MKDMESNLDQIREHLRADNAPELLIRHFEQAYRRWAEKAPATIPGRDIAPIESLPTLQSLASYQQAGEAALAKTVMIKLNGGLGTSMGLNRAKSLLHVKPGLSFLDIIARQILYLRQQHGVSIPLLFMNSFATQEDTRATLADYPDLEADQQGIPLDFLQNRIPKIAEESGLPAIYPKDPNQEWCPPGHGDIYVCLQTTGLLEKLLDRGYEYAFVSNADNLGAVLNTEILGFLDMQSISFLLEATRRTSADRKGGHLAQAADGRLLLRESAQCPPDEKEAFQDIDTYRFFNTNNLWIHLPALHKQLQECNGVLPLPVMINHKTVNPRDPDSEVVVQLETAMGSALAALPGAQAIDVPRTRFAPVKTTDDLLALRSDCFILNTAQHVVPNPQRERGTIHIQLDDAFYKRIDDFESRFAEGIPSLIACDHLNVQGDVYFSGGIRCTGTVRLVNETQTPLRLPADTTYGDPHTHSG